MLLLKLKDRAVYQLHNLTVQGTKNASLQHTAVSWDSTDSKEETKHTVYPIVYFNIALLGNKMH